MKNLLERVKEHTEKRTSPVRDATKIFIIANRTEIQKTLDHGYGVKAIWETLKKEGRIECGYSRFCQKLKKYLVPKANNSSVEERIQTKAIQPKKSAGKAEGFVFHATAKEEELY